MFGKKFISVVGSANAIRYVPRNPKKGEIGKFTPPEKLGKPGVVLNSKPRNIPKIRKISSAIENKIAMAIRFFVNAIFLLSLHK